jgi:cytochrome c-type biogenesis protein CcmH
LQPPHFIDAAQRGPVPAEIGSETTPSPKRPRGRLAAVLALLVLALAGGGYVWLGALGALPGARVTVVDRLAERLKAQPDDADGWQSLGLSYAALGKHVEAIAAFKNAVRLRPDDPTLLAQYALSAAIANPRDSSGETAQLLARALALDPKNPKALALTGTLALKRKDYPVAVHYWTQLEQIEPRDSPLAKQLQVSLAEAHRLARDASMSVAGRPMAPTSSVAPRAASATP